MNIWTVNPFDPLPGDAEQEGRYAALARQLAARGHSVTWWTSAFSHRFKRPVDQEAVLAACRPLGLEVRFLAGPPYKRNVSIARLMNHRRLASDFAARGPAEPRPPDVLVASAPPPALARQAVRLAHARGGKALVDVQDLWPETFRRLLPLPRPLADAALRPLSRTARQAYAEADALVGVADAYVARAVELGGPKTVVETIPLGVDLAAFDRAAAAGRCDRFAKTAGEFWLIYSGSLTRSYDCLTVLRAAAILHGRSAPPWRLFITGRGELEPLARRFIAERGLARVELLGFLPPAQFACLLSQCDAAINSAAPEALIYLPNKIFYYMAAGAAVLNGIAGQCERIIADAGAGLQFQPGRPDSLAAAVAQLMDDPAACRQMGLAARRLAETHYDRRILYPRYVDIIERLGASR